MKNKILSASLVAACILATSCAGLISGKTQNVFLRTSDGSENIKAEIHSSGGTQSVTIPSVVMIPRGQAPITVDVKEGKCNKESKTYLTSKYNIMLATNILGSVFGLTGTTIDMNSGAAWSYDDNAIVDVKKKSGCN